MNNFIKASLCTATLLLSQNLLASTFADIKKTPIKTTDLKVDTKTSKPVPYELGFFDAIERDLKNLKINAKDPKNTYIVLEWFNENCPYVKKYYSDKVSKKSRLQELQNLATDKGMLWYAVSSVAPDNAPKHHLTDQEARSFKTIKKASMTDFIFDENSVLEKHFAATATPHIFIINLEGDILYQGAIDSIDTLSMKHVKKNEVSYYLHDAIVALSKNKSLQIKKTKAFGCSVKR